MIEVVSSGGLFETAPQKSLSRLCRSFLLFFATRPSPYVWRVVRALPAASHCPSRPRRPGVFLLRTATAPRHSFSMHFRQEGGYARHAVRYRTGAVFLCQFLRPRDEDVLEVGTRRTIDTTCLLRLPVCLRYSSKTASPPPHFPFPISLQFLSDIASILLMR